MVDEEVIVCLAHEMAHALEKIQYGAATDHEQNWVDLAQMYAEALDSPRVAFRTPNTWVNMATITRPPTGPIIATNNHKELQKPVIVVDEAVLLQEDIQELIPTLSVIKKTVAWQTDTILLPSVTVEDIIADGAERGAHLRSNLSYVFNTCYAVPLHYLFTTIDTYAARGYLQNHGVLLDTTTKILLPDKAGAYAVTPTTPPTTSVITDLTKCKNDTDVLTVLAHQMAHAVHYVATGKTDLHDYDWWTIAVYLPRVYAVALGIEEIAIKSSVSCFQQKPLVHL
jgi:predicted SprT family Zn-dependent metalloprotease